MSATSTKKWKIAGINFDHDHMGDNLRMALNHPRAEIVGICHEDARKMQRAVANFSIPPDRVFTDYRLCLERTKPDVVLLCPATARHAEWVLKVAPFGVHVLLEKPFAASLADADLMIGAMRASGRLFAINWPLAWYPSHVTAKRLIDEGAIGEVIEVHFYGAPSFTRRTRWSSPRRRGSGKSPRAGSTRKPPAAGRCWTTWATA